MKKRKPSKARQSRSTRPYRPLDVRYSFVEGAYAEVVGGPPGETYRVTFTDLDAGQEVYRCDIETGHWVRTSRQFFTRWRTEVVRLSDGSRIFDHGFDCRGQRVFVSLESKALGDTLAWFPAVEEFRKQHGCEVICSTFMNGLFREQYPEIEFVEPGTTVHGLYAMYRLGWFYGDDGNIDFNRNVRDVRTQPMAESAYDILGLPFSKARPLLKAADAPPPLEADYVCIAVHSTAQAKYWNNPTGWQEVVDYLRGRGYQVVLLSREGDEHMGNRVPEGVIRVPEGPLENIVALLRGARLFIGIGSGLSWLAWAVGCKTCLISGFSYGYTEMPDCIRISPENGICTGCFNRCRLEAGDWNWCPDHKGTPRMFECTRTITGERVIEAIAPCL